MRFCRIRGNSPTHFHRRDGSLPNSRRSITVVHMRHLAYLLAALIASLQVAGNGPFCSAAQAISADCCSTNCPVGPPQAASDCCHVSNAHASFQSAIPAASVSLPFHASPIFRTLFVSSKACFGLFHRRLEPQARSSPLALLCSRQI
jgi:hypothetical protein